MNLKPNKHKRISFNTTSFRSPLKFNTPPNSSFCSGLPKIKGGGGGLLAATMMVLKNRLCLSFRSSFHLCVSFLVTDSLFFPETQHAVRGPSIVICDNWIFWKTLSGKNNQKWSKMTQELGFWSFKENHVISFVWNLCQMKVLKVH